MGVCALNQHFSNRGMNIMLKSGAGQAPFQDRVIIEVAARQQQQQQQQHAPQLPPPPQVQHYVVVDQLPPNAIPVKVPDLYPQYAAPEVNEYGMNENDTLLQKF